MGSNGVDLPSENLDAEGVKSRDEVSRGFEQRKSMDESVRVGNVSSDEGCNENSLPEAGNQETSSSQGSSMLQISASKKLLVTSSPRRGLDHCITAPLDPDRNLLDDNNIRFYRTMTDRKPWGHVLKLDWLSEREKKLIIELVKIQNDGTVEVDIDNSTPVASEFLELQSADGGSFFINESISEPNKSIPRLKIAMLVVGTRGDVQPFLAIAKRLQEYGHHVRLATHANFINFVRSAGVEFYPLGGDPRVLAGYMARNKGLIPSAPGEISIQRKELKAIIDSLLAACTEPDIETGVAFSAQAIIANPPAYGHVHVAEALAVPIHIFFTMPWTPTYEFPHPLARVPQAAGNWLSYIVVDFLIWLGIRGYINDFRKTKLNLPPIAYFSMYHGSISHLPTGYMWSPHLVPKPSEWGPSVDVVGYCFLNLGSKYEPKEELNQWIKKGTNPIYIGFGSMPLEDPMKTMEIILEALKDTGQRGIVDRGWGDLGNLMEVPDSVFLLEDCPHDWLFPQCAAVVHHGGAGTTATGLRAGCPTTVVPFFGDQFFWGDRVHQKGLGPAPIPIAQLSVESLSNAITFMLLPEVKSRAMELAKIIENEDGVAASVDAFHQHLPPELPLPVASPEEGEEHPSPIQGFFIQLEKCCCLPFSQ